MSATEFKFIWGTSPSGNSFLQCFANSSCSHISTLATGFQTVPVREVLLPSSFCLLPSVSGYACRRYSLSPPALISENKVDIMLTTFGQFLPSHAWKYKPYVQCGCQTRRSLSLRWKFPHFLYREVLRSGTAREKKMTIVLSQQNRFALISSEPPQTAGCIFSSIFFFFFHSLRSYLQT